MSMQIWSTSSQPKQKASTILRNNTDHLEFSPKDMQNGGCFWHIYGKSSTVHGLKSLDTDFIQSFGGAKHIKIFQLKKYNNED